MLLGNKLASQTNNGAEKKFGPQKFISPPIPPKKKEKWKKKGKRTIISWKKAVYKKDIIENVL